MHGDTISDLLVSGQQVLRCCVNKIRSGEIYKHRWIPLIKFNKHDEEMQKAIAGNGVTQSAYMVSVVTATGYS